MKKPILILALLCAASAGAQTITTSPLVLLSSTTFTMKQGVPFSASLVINGGVPPYTCTLASGSLPAGITISSPCGLTGIPTGNTLATSQVTITDSVNSSVTFGLSLTPASLSSITVTPIGQSIQANGTLQLIASSAWSDSSTFNLTNLAAWSCTGTPCGVVSQTGLLLAGGSAGTATIKAVFNGITDDGGSGISVTVSSGTIVFQTSSLPNGQINQPYSEGIPGSPSQGGIAPGQGVSLNCSGGTVPYTFAINTGTLQAGLSLSSIGVISGTPTAVGTQALTFKCTDASSNVGTSGTINLVVASLSTVTVTPVSPSVPVGGTVQFTLTGTYNDSSTANVTNQVTGGGGSLSFVKAGNCVAGSATACTVNITTASGDLALAVFDEKANSTSTLTVSDSTGTQTYTLVGSCNTSFGGRQFCAYVFPNSAALTSVTGTWSGGLSTKVTGVVYEISGAATATPVDATATNAGTSSVGSTLTSGALTTANANDILIAPLDLANNESSLTGPSGFTCPANSNALNSGANSGGLAVCYQIVSATQSGITETYSWGPGNTASALNFFALKAAAVSSGWTATDLSGTSVASISIVGGIPVATGRNAGTSTIQGCVVATCNSTVLTVNGVSDTSLVVSPASPSVVLNQTIAFTAVGNSTGNNLTATSTWVSSPTTVATMVANVATCLTAGTATITAQNGSLTGTATLSCIAATGAQPPTLPQTVPSIALPNTTGYVQATLCNSGCTYSTLAAALAGAACGTVISATAGQSESANAIPTPVKSCSEANWVIVASSDCSPTNLASCTNLPAPDTDTTHFGTRVSTSQASFMYKINDGCSGDAVIGTIGTNINNGANHYRFIGLEINLAGAGGTCTSGQQIGMYLGPGGTTTVSSSRFIVDRCYIHGSPTTNNGYGMIILVNNSAVINSNISEIHSHPNVSGGDPEAINLNGSGTSGVLIQNNFLSASSEVLMSGGNSSGCCGNSFDVTIQYNYFYKNPSWNPACAGQATCNGQSYGGQNWNVKNHLEMKIGKRWLIQGNVLDYDWVSGQDGECFQINPRHGNGDFFIDDLTIQYNMCRHVGVGYNTNGEDYATTAPPVAEHRHLVQHNLFIDFLVPPWSGGEPSFPGFTIGATPADFQLIHNTFVNGGSSSAAGMASNIKSPGVYNNPPNPLQANCTFKDNILLRGGSGWWIWDGPGLGNEGTAALNFICNTTNAPYVWKNMAIVGATLSKYPATTLAPANFAAVQFANFGGSSFLATDYALQVTSPLHNAASDGTDVGANTTALNKCITGVVAGTGLTGC